MGGGAIHELKQKMKKCRLIYVPYIRIRDYSENKMKVRNMRKSGADVMRRLTDVLYTSDIQAFCTFGTMLGFVRDGGFIKFDNDIDMGVLQTETFSWEKLEKTLNRIGMRKIKYFTCDGKVTEQTYILDKVTVDFFLYVPDGESMSVNIYFRKEGKAYASNREFELRVRKGLLVHTINKVDVNGMEVLLPENSEEYLEETYGKSWKVPDPDYVADSKDKYTVKGKKGILHTCGRNGKAK